MDKGIANAECAFSARGKSVSGNHGYFIRFAMATVIGSVDSRSFGNLQWFEYFALWLFVDHVSTAFSGCGSRSVSAVSFNFGRHVAIPQVREFLADIRPSQALRFRLALADIAIEIYRFVSGALFFYCELRQVSFSLDHP